MTKTIQRKGKEGKYKTHASKKKKDTVTALQELMGQYKNIAAIDLENLPARQLQAMKENLRGKVRIYLAKKRLITLAIDGSKKEGIMQLKPHLKGMPALLFTDESPFKLYSTMKKSKSKAPIKGGQKAPHDIVVKAQTTTFAPGPIIGELGAFKIKTGIDGGKVAIKADSIVAKEGEVVNQKLASILQRLGIEPMEIGLNIVAVLENGEILTKDVLDIDETKYFADIARSQADSLALAIEIGYACPETIVRLIGKANRAAFSIAVEAAVPLPETIGAIFAKASAQAESLGHSH